MTVTFEQCNDATRTKIAFSAFYDADREAGELIKFFTRIHTVCNQSNNGSLIFGGHVAEIVEHKFRPVQSIEELLAAHLMDDVIWDHTDPCDVSLGTVDNTEIIVSSHTMEESTYTVVNPILMSFSLVVVSMPYKDDKSWFDAYEDDNSWYDALEPLDKYGKWNKPPNTDGVDSVTNESTTKCIKPDFYTNERQT